MTLRRSILILILSLLLGTLGFVGGVNLVTTRSSIEDLRAQIMERTEESVIHELETYFGRVEPALEFMRESLFQGPEALESWKETGLQLAHFLRTEPGLSFLYVAEADTGHLLGCQRDPDGRLVINYTHSSNNRKPFLLEVLSGDEVRPYVGAVQPSEAYDSRERPWFKEAAANEGLVWTKPYEFLNSEILGITATVAARGEDGKVDMVFAADLVLTDVAKFLDGCQVGESGEAFILLSDGSLLVDDKYRLDKNTRTLQEALLSQSLDLKSLETKKRLEFGFLHEGVKCLAILQPIDVPGKGRFIAAVVVPETEFMGVVTRNATMTMAATIGIVAVAILLSVLLSGRVTGPLAEISDELELIGQLDFPEREVARSSSIREIAKFNDSLGKMKLSLRSFSRYVPQDLVREVLQDKDEARLGGRLQHITVQFSDLAGFTPLSESLPPDEVFLELRDFLELLQRNQSRYGGITSTFTGDGTMALFNAPRPLEKHAAMACRAALDSVVELSEMNAKRREEGKVELNGRFGINTAEVLLGNLGTSDRFTYTAVGDGVNLASRLEGLNKLYGTLILAGEACREEAGDEFEWRRIDRIAVVGRRRALTIYEPLGKKGEVGDAILEARDRYEEALQAYSAADFGEALERFGSLRKSRHGNSAAAVLYDRVAELIETRVSADWDGTYVAPFK